MNTKLIALIKKVCKKWDYYKSLEMQTKGYDATRVQTVFGDEMEWDNPDILWLMNCVEGGGYEEYGSQVGLTRDGKIVWEYQSHCSCNDFGDSVGHGDGELCIGCEKDPKSYQLNNIPDDWEAIVKKNLEAILTREHD